MEQIAIMLSGETAAGIYPVESVQTMNKIAEHTENSLDYERIVSARSREKETTMTEAISQAVAYTSINLGVKAVLAPTESGNTAKMIAKYRPGVPIVAITDSVNSARMLTLVWGVFPVVCQRVTTTDEILELAVDETFKTRLCNTR